MKKMEISKREYNQLCDLVSQIKNCAVLLVDATESVQLQFEQLKAKNTEFKKSKNDAFTPTIM